MHECTYVEEEKEKTQYKSRNKKHRTYLNSDERKSLKYAEVCFC